MKKSVLNIRFRIEFDMVPLSTVLTYQLYEKIHLYRSSCPEVFSKKGVLRNFAKFAGKHLCQGLFFNKVAGGACNFIKKETLAQVFSCEFCEISKNTFSYRTPPVAASVRRVSTDMI